MLDIRHLRADLEGTVKALAKRGEDFAPALSELLSLDDQRRNALTAVNELKARRNEVSKEIGVRKRAGERAADMVESMRELGEEIGDLDQIASGAEERLREILLATPNVPLDAVPAGGEEANRILREWGELRSFDFEPKPHWEIGEDLGILDFTRAAKISGSGFTVRRGRGARLQRGLINWFLDVHTEQNGYVEVGVPYLVTREALERTGQLPKFADESYEVVRDGLWLIPTAEVPVTNLHADEMLSAEDLPVRYTAVSPCFRREAGAAGKDTRGLLRVHQFDKVELVHFEAPERSLEALEELTRDAEGLLEALGLPYRRVLLAAGDLGFSAAMTYDLEIWAPGVRRWLEVSSCSTFTDYQARRANVRFRPAPGQKPEFVHTLNGSALALPRLMATILETFQEEDGSVTIPEVVRPYVGFDRLTPPSA